MQLKLVKNIKRIVITLKVFELLKSLFRFYKWQKYRENDGSYWLK